MAVRTPYPSERTSMRLRPSHSLFLRVAGVACVAGSPFLMMACKKDPPPPPPPAPTPTPVETAPLELAPLVEDAGADADAEAGKPKATGPGVSANVSRAKQCCNALRNQGKQLGASPEAAQLNSIATMCDAVAGQLGSGAGQDPAFAPVRAMLQGKTLPAACQGL